MRVMIFAKSTPESELKVHGGDGNEDMATAYAEMAAFHEELSRAGVLIASERLEPSTKGARVTFEGDKRSVVDGPFTESKELVAGYWLWQVRSLDEAIEWLQRAPFPDGVELELRPILEMDGLEAQA